jgi:competence protein ComEC
VLVFIAGGSLLTGLLLTRASREIAAHAALLLGFLAAGGVTTQLFDLRFPPDHVRHLAGRGADFADPVRLEGNVVSTPQRTPDELQFDLDVKRVDSRRLSFATEGRVRLRLIVGDDRESMELADSLRIEYGDGVRVMAQLRRPRTYRNPGSFDYPRWLESVEDISFIGTIKSPHLVEKLPSQNEAGFEKSIQAVRQRLLDGIDRIYPPWTRQGREGAVLKAVLLGDSTSLSTETVENFRRTGLYHQLVVSGEQLGLLAFLVGLFLHWLRLREEFQITLLLAAMLTYALLLEQRAPTLRATLMIFVYLAARFLYRPRSLLNAVGASALVLLVMRPFWLFESGFQLSFAAALLIAGLAVTILERTTEPFRRALRDLPNADRDARLEPRLAQFRLDLRGLAASFSKRLDFLDRHPRVSLRMMAMPVEAALWVASALLFSAILQVGLLLPMTETFHRVTIAGILLNALATPLMTILLGLAAPTVVLAAVSPTLALLPAKALSLVTAGFIAVAEFNGFPAWVSYRVPDPPLWVSLGFALLVLLAGWSITSSRRMFWFSLAGAGVFAALISFPPFPARIPRGALEVTALDCGGGDALFVVLPDQTTMLVDACGSRTSNPAELNRGAWDQGENVVSPYLWSRGITRIDLVVLSHARQDHLGGLTAVFRNFRVGKFWHAVNPLTPAYLRLLHEADSFGIQDRQLAAGQTILIGETKIGILWPPAHRMAGERPVDNDSLVMRVSAAGGSVLLTGDIDEEAEAELIRQGVTLQSQILKVAGHGARDSSSAAFLDKVEPSIALITAGRGSFGELPSAETLARLQAARARVFQPGLSGAVTAQIRDGQITVRSHTDSPHP